LGKQKAENRNAADEILNKRKSKMQKTEMRGRLADEFRARTKRYAAGVIRLYVKLPKAREEARVPGKQLLRSGTSIAAHVREASRARSDEEFVSKLGGAVQEADESQLWLELLRDECGLASSDALPMEKEADELMAIMTTMINRTKSRI
jgi:four helix bundle protein